MGSDLAGVYAAAPTPLTPDLEPDLATVGRLLGHLEGLGCHGALVLGTTGEGPSFSVMERRRVMDAAARWRRDHPDFRLLAGTGCAALPDTVELTRAALAAGFEAAVLLPPFYFKAVAAAGLAKAYRHIIEAAVAPGGRVILYHIPRVSGVAIPLEVVTALAREYPHVVAGVKDSGGDMAHTQRLCARHGELAVLTGTDAHLAACLQAGGAGAITAMANLRGDLARRVFDLLAEGRDAGRETESLVAARRAFDAFPTVPAVKALLARGWSQEPWPVRPPLQDLTAEETETLAAAFGPLAFGAGGPGP